MRKVTYYDLCGIDEPKYQETLRGEKVLGHRKQGEYGQKKRIKP